MQADDATVPRKSNGDRTVKPRKPRRTVVWTPLRITVFATLLVANAVVGRLLAGVGTNMDDEGMGKAVSIIGFLMVLLVHPILLFMLTGDAMMAGLLGIAAGLTLAKTSLSAGADMVGPLSGEKADFSGDGIAACAAFLALVPTIVLAARYRTAERRRREAYAARAVVLEQPEDGI